MVEIFKTDIVTKEQAGRIVDLLLLRWPGYRINVDLQDCDNILRVEGTGIIPHHITQLLTENGFSCRILD